VQLVSHDSKSNTAVQHHTFSIEIAPLCREDLVCLPKPLYTALGGFGPMVLVHKVYSSIVFVDPTTLRAQHIEGTLFWKSPFAAYANSKRMITFFVLGVDQKNVVNGKLRLADVTVCLEDEVGGDRSWTVRSHLGALLKEGDLVKGYHVEALNPNSDYVAAYPASALPDVVLVHKHYENQASRRARRAWTIRKLDVGEGQAAGGRRALADRERELEDFKDDLERDPEFRKDVQLYYDPMSDAARARARAGATAAAAAAAGAAAGASSSSGAAAAAKGPGEEDEEDEAMVDLAELVDELRVTQPRRSRDADGEDGAAAADSGDEDGLADAMARERRES
jgi:nonsense-mediated mRNA decay protein 3